MGFPIAKFAPTGAVVGFVGFCLWPALFSSAPEGVEKQAAKMPEIAPTIMSPVIAPVPARDPFRLAGELRAVAVTTQGKKSKTANGGISVGPPGAAQRSGGPGTPAGAKSATASKGHAATVDKVSAPGGFVLRGTSIHGDQRLALINDQVYAQGDTLAVQGTDTTPYQVAKIMPHKVLLSYHSTVTELCYSDVTTPNVASTDASAPAKAATAPGERSLLNPKSPPKPKK